MTKITLPLLVALIFSLMACKAPAPKPEAIKSANYGTRPSSQTMLNAVQQYMSQRLVDPDSAKYQCGIPTKSWITAGYSDDDNATSDRTYFGYYFICYINAKNRLGGYAGNQEYHFMIYPTAKGSAIVHFAGFSAGAPVE